MGASQDLESEGLRRLLVNASYWCLGMDVPAAANVAIVGSFRPRPFGVRRPEDPPERGFKQGVRPADLEMK
jgi:hypothetical protein